MMVSVLIGFFAGIVSGMGIGGGAILIPAITFFGSMSQQDAQSINLIYFIPTGIIALITHIKNGNIKKRVLLKLILFGFLGAVTGSMIAIKLDSDLLRKIFGSFLLIMGIVEFRKKE